MHKFTILTSAALAVLLAGCSGKDAGSDNAAKDGAAATRAAGNWTNEVEVIKLEMPGMPPEMQEGMKAMMTSSGSTNYCLTEEEAKKDDLERLLAEGPGNGGECTWERKEINGNKVDIAGTCTQEGQKADLAMAGTMAANQSDMTITTKAIAPNGQPTEMVMRVKSQRTGPCSAESEKENS